MSYLEKYQKYKNMYLSFKKQKEDKEIIFSQIRNNIINLKKKDIKFGCVIKNGYPVIEHLIFTYDVSVIGELALYVNDIVDYFIVSYLDFGIILRKVNITKPILLLNIQEFNVIEKVEDYNLEMIMPNLSYYNIAKKSIKNQLKVHLWFDSGFKRGGINSEEEFINFYKYLSNKDNINIIGIGTKYSTKINNGKLNDDIILQHNRFKKLINHSSFNNKNLLIHATASKEVDNDFTESYFDMIRVGYKIYRFVKWNQQIIDIFEVSKEDCIGYYCGNSILTKEDGKVGIIKNNMRLALDTIKGIRINNNKKIIFFNYDIIGFRLDDNMKIGSYVEIFCNEQLIKLK